MPPIAAVGFCIVVDFLGRRRFKGLRIGGRRNDRDNEENRGQRYRGRVQVEHHFHSLVSPIQTRSCGDRDGAARSSNAYAVVFFPRTARPGWSDGGVFVEFGAEWAGRR